MRNQTLIALPPERADMLREIAKRLDKPIADLIGDLVLDHVARGTIEDKTPGVSIIAEFGSTLFGIMAKNGEPMVIGLLTPQQTRQLAEAIDTTAQRRTIGGKEAQFGPFKISVGRVGTGVLFAQDDLRRTVAPSVAKDIARQLRKAADKSEAYEESAEAA